MKNMSHELFYLRTKMFEVTYFTVISLNCGGRKEGPTPKNAYIQPNVFDLVLNQYRPRAL